MPVNMSLLYFINEEDRIEAMKAGPHQHFTLDKF